MVNSCFTLSVKNYFILSVKNYRFILVHLPSIFMSTVKRDVRPPVVGLFPLQEDRGFKSLVIIALDQWIN